MEMGGGGTMRSKMRDKHSKDKQHNTDLISGNRGWSEFPKSGRQGNMKVSRKY